MNITIGVLLYISIKVLFREEFFFRKGGGEKPKIFWKIYTPAIQGIAEGVNEILKQRINSKSSQQEDTEKYNSGAFFKFCGTH